MEQPVAHKGHPDNKANNKADQKKNAWGRMLALDWRLWTDHPVSLFALFIGGILLAPVTTFPGGNPKQLWYVAGGLWIILGAIIWFAFANWIGWLEGKELLTTRESERRENEYRESIQERLSALETGMAENKVRSLSPSQRQAIKEAIAPHAGQKVRVLSLLYDTEATRYAQDFVSVFNEAGWECGPIENSLINPEIYNVRVYVKETARENAPPAAFVLQAFLIELGLTKDDGLLHFADRLGDGEISLMIGAKPPINAEPDADSLQP
jgi:hypothetical protein